MLYTLRESILLVPIVTHHIGGLSAHREAKLIPRIVLIGVIIVWWGSLGL
jgi:hypothetical protein